MHRVNMQTHHLMNAVITLNLYEHKNTSSVGVHFFWSLTICDPHVSLCVSQRHMGSIPTEPHRGREGEEAALPLGGPIPGGYHCGDVSFDQRCCF